MGIYKFLFNNLKKMANKKKSTPKKRRSHNKGLSAPAKRKHHKRRSKGLGDMFNPTMAMNAAKNVAGGAAGGFGAMVVTKSILPADSGKLVRVGTGLVGAFIVSALGFPAIGSGFAGGMTAIAFPNGLLGEDDNNQFADDEALSESPIFLNDDGEPMMLQEDPETGAMSWRYLSEEEMAEFEEAEEA